MPTVIDSLIVTLGLDPSQFTKGQKEAGAAIIKTLEEVVKSGKEIELSTRSVTNFISQLRGQFLSLFAIVAGGRGLTSFASDLVRTSAAVGRMSVLLNTTSQDLSKWQGAGAAFGGTAQGITSSITTLNQSLQQLSLTGEASFIPYLRALQAYAPGANLSLQGMNGEIRDAISLLPDLHKAFQGMNAARAKAIGNGLGLSDDLINILIQSDEVFNKFMKDQERWGLVTKEQAKAAQDLEYNMGGVTQSFSTLGRMLITDLAPYLIRIMQIAQDTFVWLQKNPEQLRTIFTVLAAGFAAFAIWVAGPIGWIAALAAAIALLWDDWNTYNEGGKARFAEFWSEVDRGWKIIRETALRVWNDIREYVQPIIDALKMYVEAYVEATIAGWKLIYSVFFGTAEDIKRNWQALLTALNKGWTAFADNLVKAIVNVAPVIFDAIKKAMAAAFDWVFERLNTVIEAIGGKRIQNPFTGGGPTTGNLGPAAGQGSGDGTVNYSGASAPGYDKKNDNKLMSDVDFFVSKGWSRDQAIGIVANIAGESGGSHTNIGDKGLAFGLAQWHADRRAKFKEKFGHTMEEGTREEQLEFIHHELTVGDERAAGNNLRKATSATQATDIVTRQYERPQFPDADSFKRQIAASHIARLPAPAVTPGGAPTAAQVASSNVANDNSRQSQTNVQQVVVNTQATDAAGIAKDIKPALERDNDAMQANNGYM